MAKHDLITKDFALYVVHYFASMLTWSKEDILSEIDRTIKEAKPADSVPVVRCKDCKHDNMTTCPLCWIEKHTLQFINHDPEFYCGNGERRTDDG